MLADAPCPPDLLHIIKRMGPTTRTTRRVRWQTDSSASQAPRQLLWIPAANQAPPALTINNTGLSQGFVGRGERTSSIRKSPLGCRGTSTESLATPPQNRRARTLWLPLVPIPLPPANSRPRPSTEIRPSVFTSAVSRAITHGMPAGLTPCTMFGAEPAATPRNG